MNKKVEQFIQSTLKKDLPDIRPGDTIRIHQKVKEGEKEKVQIFEGDVLARKHGKEMGATITIKKILSGIGVLRIFPLHSPTIEKIEILERGKVRRARLYYLKNIKGKLAKVKKEELVEEKS